MMAAKQIAAKLSWDDRTRMWVAQSTAPAGTARGTTTEDAVMYLKRALTEQLGRQAFEINATIELPEKLKTLAAHARQVDADIERLAQELPRVRSLFLHVAKGEFSMTQLDAAKLLGITPSYLSKIKVQLSPEDTEEISNRILRTGQRKRTT